MTEINFIELCEVVNKEFNVKPGDESQVMSGKKNERTERWLGADRAKNQIRNWLRRGDKAAIYQNMDLASSRSGHIKIVSYGSPAAQIETDAPPVRLPDTEKEANWAYQLIAICTKE